MGFHILLSLTACFSSQRIELHTGLCIYLYSRSIFIVPLCFMFTGIGATVVEAWRKRYGKSRLIVAPRLRPGFSVTKSRLRPADFAGPRRDVSYIYICAQSRGKRCSGDSAQRERRGNVSREEEVYEDAGNFELIESCSSDCCILRIEYFLIFYNFSPSFEL